MAISDALAWRLNNGGTAADLYADINTFLASSPDAATTQALMAQYGISGEDVAAATGGKSGGLLGGNILAGASWNSLNKTLGDELTAATGQASSNYAVGGATTADTLAQLNTYLAGGGQFDPNATVYLQTGGVDFLQGVDKGTIKDNINQIVKTLGAQGVDVVLTGSPYAKSIDDVINNNFDPKVDQIFTDIAKENKNVALVGVQGEILQNKKLLVDALHTNAEGTAIYNQAVIDSLSQFKNEVPSSTPQAIAQVQKTNTVATTPPVITQAAASPAVAQALAVQAPNIQELIASGVLQPNQATLIGDTYYQPIYTQIGSGEDAQLGPLENVITYKANENKAGGSYNQYTPTGELERVGTQQKVASFAGGLAEMLNDPVIQAALLGGGAGGALGGVLGLTGSTAQAVGTGLLKGGSAAAGGASLGDALKTGLLSGGLVYGGNLLANMDVPVDFNNMTADQLDEALQTNLVKDLRQAGVTNPSEFLTGQGANAAKYIQESIAATDLANNLSNSGLSSNQVSQLLDSAGFTQTAITDALDSLPTNIPSSSIASLVPSGGTVAITAPTTPSLSNVLSTIASTTPAVTVTAPKTPQAVDQATLDLVNSQLAANVTAPTNLANVQVTGNRPTTIQDTINTIAATIPSISSVTQPIAQQTITGEKPATKQELINAITSTIPSVSPAQAAVVAEQVITSGKNVSVNDAVSALTAAIPTITTPTVTTPTTVPTTTITAPKPAVTTQNVINTIAATIPTATTPTTVPTTTITADRPVTSTQDLINTITAAIPSVIAPTTIPTTTITADRPTPTTQDLINTIAATIPAVIQPTTVPTTTITADRPSSITDAVTAATIPLIQPSTPLTVPQVTAQTTTPTVDPLRVAQLGLTAAGLLGAGSALSGGSTATQYPVVPVPESWTTPITGTTGTTGTTAYSQLPAINFGDRNLLRGTQWEKFLSPNYGQVPAPVQYSQPSNLSYNDLMGILGSRQGMPARSNLSINDIISGIQNQYGQTPASTVG